MNMLDRKLKLRLEVLKIETKLLIRYIDDVRVIMERIRLGSVIRGDRVEIDQEQMVLDSQLADPEVEVTARILKEVMNTLVDGIVFTTETRADFTSEWGIPTLDTMFRMEEAGAGCRRRVAYKFYKKPVSTKYVTPYRSAQAINGKIATLSQDVFRILANCSDSVRPEERAELLDQF